MIARFANNDSAFHQWGATHPNGFILNIRKRLDEYAVLHKVGCPSLKNVTGKHPQPHTGNQYQKVVSLAYKDLDDVYMDRQEELELDELFLAYRCKTCNPA